MKARFRSMLIYGVPALMAALLTAALVTAALAGMLWLFVFGDDPWPAWGETLFVVMLIAVALSVWGALLAAAYAAGKREEVRPPSSPSATRHAWIAAGATLLIIVLVIAHQWSVGNLGPVSSGIACSDHCRDHGFDASMVSPRDAGSPTCSCLDAQGREGLRTPLAEIDGPARR